MVENDIHPFTKVNNKNLKDYDKTNNINYMVGQYLNF